MNSITLLFIIIFGTFLIINAQQICEPKFEIPQFLGNQIKGNYFKAQQICHLMGKRVLTPDTAQKDEAAIKFMKENGIIDMWTSGNDLVEEGTFNWIQVVTSGILVNYTNWNVGQPDNAGNNENCIQMWFRDGDYKWNDIPCTVTLNIVCEDNPENCSNIR